MNPWFKLSWLLPALGLLPAPVSGTEVPHVYSLGLEDASNAYDAPVPGFVGPDGEGMAPMPDGYGGFFNARNYVNPLFFGWANGFTAYHRADGQAGKSNPALALGPVTGNEFDTVSLGDLTEDQITAGAALGTVTLTFAKPITNLPGADLVIYENALKAGEDTGGAGTGGIWAELAYVEVSSGGTHFARFPSRSRTPGPVGPLGTIDPRLVFNLAGKHVNGSGLSWGTPFHLEDLANHPLVVDNLLDLTDITHVRIVDVPGRGDFKDSTGGSIYDGYLTTGTGGFDLEALGAVSVRMSFADWQDLRGLPQAARGESADAEHDGVPNLLEYAFAMLPDQADRHGLPQLVEGADRAAISFVRDVRAADLIYEVEACSELGAWEVIARSTSGGELHAVAPFAPVIEDAPASHITGIGVLRRQVVHDVQARPTAGQRFLRVKITRTLATP